MKNENIYPNLTDSHTHLLHMADKGVDVPDFLLRWKEKGGAWILDAGVDENLFEERLAYRSQFSKLVYSAGIHPGDCGDGADLEKRIELIKGQLDHEAVVALGEIGLDYYWKDVKPIIQKNFLHAQLDLAIEKEMPVIIHNREADVDCLEILKEHPNSRGGIMHCYSSDYEFAKKVLDLGFYISFAGNVTYKNSFGIQATAQRIPLDRLLIETDAPYLSPQKMRGKTNHPGHLGYSADFIASIRGITPEKLVCQSTENFESLFQITR